MPDFVYDEKWLETQTGTHEWGRRALLGAMAHLGIPRTLLDVGCGDGFVVDFAAHVGLEAVGIDIAPRAGRTPSGGEIIKGDLSQPFNLYKRFDFVVCWEVGEHLPAAAADTLVESIIRHAGRFIIFTAAKVGQGGDGHINCQPQEYWREKLQARGADYLKNATDHLRDTWAWTTGPALWYPQNLQVFLIGDAPSEDWYNK